MIFVSTSHACFADMMCPLLPKCPPPRASLSLIDSPKIPTRLHMYWTAMTACMPEFMLYGQLNGPTPSRRRSTRSWK